MFIDLPETYGGEWWEPVLNHPVGTLEDSTSFGWWVHNPNWNSHPATFIPDTERLIPNEYLHSPSETYASL